MCWWLGAPNPRIIVPWFGQHHMRSSSYRASRGHLWNRWKVYDQLPCWKWIQNPDNWATFHQWHRSILDIPDHGGGSGLSFISSMQAPAEATDWGSGNTYNQSWGGSRFGPYRMNNFTWGDSVSLARAYLPRSLINPHAAACRIRDIFLCLGRWECFRSPYNWRNPIINPQVHCLGRQQGGSGYSIIFV